jgi:hypothetical protein
MANIATCVMGTRFMGMTRWRGGLLVAVSLALYGAAPALATPRLAPSRVLSPVATPAADPAVAVGGDGRTVVVWDTPQGAHMDLGHGRIEARLGRVDGAWGAPATLSRDGEAPIAAIGADGTAAVAWSTLGKGEGHEGRTSIYVSTAAPDRPFGRARLVAAGRQLSEPEGLEVKPRGEVVLVWSRELPLMSGVNSIRRKDVYFALLEPGSSPARVGTVAVAGGGRGSVSATETEGGVVLVAVPTALLPPPSVVNQQVAVAALSAGGVEFAQPQTIEAEPGNPYAEVASAELAAGPGGAALTFANTVYELQPGGTFGVPLEVTESPPEAAEREAVDRESEPSTGPISTEDLSAAFPADGAQVAAWQRTKGLTPVGGVAWRRVMVAIRPAAAGAFGYPVRLSLGAGLSGEPKITAAGGATLVLWAQNTLPCKQRVFAAVRPAGGGFLSPVAVSNIYRPERNECHFGSGQLALAGSGRYAIAGWVQNMVLHITTLTG